MEHLYRYKYTIYMEKHGFQNNQYFKQQNMHKENTGCGISDFDKILLSNSKNKSIT